MTANYSGIEQSFKFLIAENKQITIEKLLECSKYRTHDLEFLFQELDEEAQDVLGEHYKRFQSLHNYIEMATLLGFLKKVSGAEGKGYEKWRYALIQLDPVPANTADGMLAIWKASVQLMMKRQYHGYKALSFDRELLEVFEDILQDAWDEIYRRRQMADMDVPDDPEAFLEEWFECYDHPINAYAQLLWGCHRGLDVEYVRCLDWLAELFHEWVEKTKEQSTGRNLASLQYFVIRAEGNSRTGLGIRWNTESARFEDIPWNLPETVVKEIPQSAQRMNGDMGRVREEILKKMHKSGFTVKECRSYAEREEGEEWACTLMAEKAQTAGDNIILKVWEKVWGSYIFVDLNGNESEEFDEVQRWVKMLSNRH